MYLPRADSGRLVIGTWWLVVLVIVTTYSGNLVAFLTFPKLEAPVTTISELLKNSDAYTWSVTKGSYLEMELKVMNGLGEINCLLSYLEEITFSDKPIVHMLYLPNELCSILVMLFSMFIILRF